MADWTILQKRCVLNTYVNRQLAIARGDGCYLYSASGERYLDLMSSYGAAILGYRHPLLEQTLIEQARTLPVLHGSFAAQARVEASKLLLERCGAAFSKVYWSNSGAEAIEAALKFAVLASKKKRFIVCDNGYHGKTLGALSATAGEKYRAPFEPLLWDFHAIAYGDAAQLEDAIDANTAAFLLEPIQGEGGVIVPPPGYLKHVREICQRRQVLLILDEIQTGCGRSGAFLAGEHEGVSADILCLGKGLAGGLPVGATLMGEEIAQAIPVAIHSSTFGGSPLICALVKTVLEILTGPFMAEIAHKGAYFRDRLLRLHTKAPVHNGVRGKGLMLAIDLGSERNHYLKRFQDEKILALPAAASAIRFLPPYTIAYADLDLALTTIGAIFKQG